MSYLSTQYEDQLKKEAEKAEKTGKLTEKQLEIIYSHKLFNLFVPKSSGGLELDLISGLEIQEEISKIDGSLGWTVTLCSGANAFVGYLSPDLVKELFCNPQVCFAGSGKIGGIAQETQDGYLVNGKWSYVTGTPHTTIFTANCQIQREGKLLTNADGSPYYKSFFFNPEEVTIIRDWNTLGLIATASHSYEVKDLKIGFNRTFSIDGASRTIDHLIYQYPFLTFAELTLTINHLGMQQHFLEQAQLIFNSIKEPVYKDFRTQLLEKSKEKIETKRDLFFHYATISWKELQTQGQVSEESLQKINELCREIVKEGRNTILEIYPYLGIPAANPDTEINRVLRDILTASQHILLL